MKKEEFYKKIKNAVFDFDKKAQVILFGSRARGTPNPDSDWDILVLTSFPVNERKKRILRDKLFNVELETEQAISSIIHSANNWKKLNVTPLFKNIQKEGVSI